uniref:40S ribosomal protein S21 n=1 Tax=Euglena gracilis TaxID=3039 RepID=A0A7L5NXY5_EUGGR|nr:40S small subunit ribosomal protein eS21 [Euglena gracilis]6ZJ3_SY Chain SY, Ribosomal protein eS21 [Euglena gracilis]
MLNDEGINVDAYIPRKCSATNQLITAKDHASVQFNVGLIDENGAYIGEYKTIAFAGFLRRGAASDQALNRLMLAANILKEKGESEVVDVPKQRRGH